MPTQIWVILAGYALASFIAFIAFALDKRAAAKNRWRTPERTLHLIELFGGWPGSLLAIYTLRHKNRKASFVVVTFLIVGLHAAGWVLWFAYGR